MGCMDHPLDVGELSLLVRALHRDVSDLDERLRRLEQVVRELQETLAVPDAAPIEIRLEALPGA
jgi:hypothetical protein